MRIVGTVTHQGHVIIDAYVWCRKPHIFGPVTFLVDTGATVTTLLATASLQLKIDFKELRRAEPPIVVGKPPPVYGIPNHELIFRTEENKIHPVKLKKIEAVVPTGRPRYVHIANSLLGMDVISKFRFVYDDKSAYFEK